MHGVGRLLLSTLLLSYTSKPRSDALRDAGVHGRWKCWGPNGDGRSTKDPGRCPNKAYELEGVVSYPRSMLSAVDM